jgi:DnaJ-class molecular chaperone
MSNIKGKSKNYYRLLNLKKNASSHEILISYQKLITHWTKYINKSPIARERIIDIKKAYGILSDPITKKKYDLKIKKKDININNDTRATNNINTNILENIMGNIIPINNIKNNIFSDIISNIKMMNSFIPMTTNIKVIDLSNTSKINKMCDKGPEIELLN